MKWKKISEERFHEMLEIIPPLGQNSVGFLVGEEWDTASDGAPGFSAFAQWAGSAWECDTPLSLAQWRAIDPTTIRED